MARHFCLAVNLDLLCNSLVRVKGKYRPAHALCQTDMEQDTAIPLNFIDTGPRLEEAVRHLSRQTIIAADLEADSMFHFNEQVCLIQIASRDRIYIIDPLPITDMAPLKQLMEAAGIRKVFHGADYDVRSLYRDFNINIENLFDTEIASRFLGYAETGLNALIRIHFNVML